QLKGVQAAVLSRSSKLHGFLSTDHPFEYLGGLSLAVRRVDGASPSLYVADLREQASRITQASRFLADEMRARTFNPHWISEMQKEGYSGTLEILNAVNNMWGWQVVDKTMVRADQWQGVHDTFIRDSRDLKLQAWFEQHNPTAQLQIIERMVEAIRKGYWDAADQTKRELVERLEELAQRNVSLDRGVTAEFVSQMAAGFGLAKPLNDPAQTPVAAANQVQSVSGAVLEQVTPGAAGNSSWWQSALALALLAMAFVAGALLQLRANSRLLTGMR
ncbi:MAG: cobaltochelatase subunit CobN, partial [Pseudomonadota bacterium]|nr:cobaltochelatase subunit CobN [Pseudomonadota bacterium]